MMAFELLRRGRDAGYPNGTRHNGVMGTLLSLLVRLQCSVTAAVSDV